MVEGLLSLQRWGLSVASVFGVVVILPTVQAEFGVDRGDGFNTLYHDNDWVCCR